MKIKRVFVLSLLFVLGIAQLCFGAGEKKTRVHLIYKVPEAILQVQNKEENIVEGQKEFEATLLKYYEKRFQVKKIERVPMDKLLYPEDCLKMTTPLETPLVVKILLEGTGTAVDHYQNAFGAKVDGVAPSTKVHLQEAIADRNDYKLYGIDYGTQEYTSGTFSLGRIVVAADTNPRTNVKNAVNACIRDACVFNRHNINKYVNPGDYAMEEARYKGDFKTWDLALSQKKAQQEAAEAPLRAIIEKFRKFAEEHPEYGILPMLNMYQYNLQSQKTIMDTYIQMGMYKE